MNHLCPVCNTSYPSDVVFCTKDGTRLITSEDPISERETSEDPFAYVEAPLSNPFERQPKVGQLYRKASMVNRLLAALLDSLIFFALIIPVLLAFFVAYIIASGNQENLALAFCFAGILLALIPLAFQLLKDGFGKGQSPGKRALKLMVIDLDTNLPCTKIKSSLRNVIIILLGMVPFVGGFIEAIMVVVTEDGRRLGDRAANTMVIEKSEYLG